LPFEQAVHLTEERRGTHFDPAVVDAFLHIAPALDHNSERNARASGAGHPS
jgi:response regulator RpfG family c-di-GMP phosphodiesterase